MYSTKVLAFTISAMLIIFASVLLIDTRNKNVDDDVNGKKNTDTLERDDDYGVSERIMFGSRAPFDKYPWFAEGIGCGAALIAPEFLVTASHCNVDRFRRVKIGAVCTGQVNEDRRYDNCGAPVEERYRKRVFKLTDKNSLHTDLMLIQLDQRAQVTPVGIDDGTLVDTYAAGKGNLWTPGFGQTQHGSSSDYLMQVSGKFVPPKECHKKTKDQDDIVAAIVDGMICVQNDNAKKQACFGDSGGPLYDWSAKKIIGVVSTGNRSCRGYPTIYTSLGDHYDWIKSTICMHHSDPKPSMCYDKPTPMLLSKPSFSPSLQPSAYESTQPSPTSTTSTEEITTAHTDTLASANTSSCETYSYTREDDGKIFTETFCKSDNEQKRFDMFEISLPQRDLERSVTEGQHLRRPQAAWENVSTNKSTGLTTRNVALKNQVSVSSCPVGQNHMSICKTACSKVADGLFEKCNYQVKECKQKPSDDGECLTVGSCAFSGCKWSWKILDI